MILEWRTRAGGGTQTVDIRITRESDDVWCISETQDANLNWNVRASSALTDRLVQIGVVLNFDHANEIITVTYTNQPRRYLYEVRGRSGISNYFHLRWDPRILRPAHSGAYEIMPAPAILSFHSTIHCPPEPGTDSLWSSLARMVPLPTQSTDSTWSSLAQMVPLPTQSTDSSWSSLQRMTAFNEPSTDSNWSSLQQLTPLAPIGPINRAPVLRPFSDQIIEVDSSFTLDLDDYGSDPDGDTLTYTVTANNTLPLVPTDPPAINITNPRRREYLFYGQTVGSSRITVVVSDGSLSATGTFAVRIVPEVVGNRPPTIDELGVKFVRLGVRGEVSFVNQRGLSDPDDDDVYITIDYTDNPGYYAYVDGRDTIFIDGLQVGIYTLNIIPVDEHALAGTSTPLTIVVYQPLVGNRPPVCSRLLRLRRGLSNSVQHTSRDLSSYFSDPDGHRVFIRRVDWDRVHGGNIILRVDTDNILYVTYSGFAAGIVTLTPTDEYGLDGEECFFLVYIGYNYDRPNDENRYPGVIGPIPNITVCLGETVDYEITDYLYTPEVTNPRIQYRKNYGTAEVLVQDFQGTTDPSRQFAHITSTQVGFAEINVRIPDAGFHGASNSQNFFVTVEDCAATTDSEWSSLASIPMLSVPATDSNWSSLLEMLELSTDSDWSFLERMTPIEPGTDSNWSNLLEMLEPGTDSDWSNLEQMTPFTMDGPWSDIISTVTLDGPWSQLIDNATEDGPWSDPIAFYTVDGPWSAFIITPTRDGPWSDIITTLSLDGPWSTIIVTPTRDGPWSDILGAVTRDGPWSAVIRDLETTDGPWSGLLGPIINDSAWSEFAVLGTQDGPWSEPLGNLTEDGPWSDMIGPIINDSAWSEFAEYIPPPTIVPTTDSDWSDLELMRPFHSPWSALSNVTYSARAGSPVLVVYHGVWVASNIAYRVRPAVVETIVARGLWSPVSAPAFLPRSSDIAQVVYQSDWSPLSNIAHQPRADSPVEVLYHGTWQASNLTHRPRHGDVALIISNSQWSSPTSPTYLPREGPLQALVYAEWSGVSNLAYKSRHGPLEPVLYRSEWSPVSNIARQEREVLSAIGGAEPFLHIYEARRGLVRIMRLIDHATPGLFGTAFEEAAVNLAMSDDDRVLVNPLILLSDLRDGQVAIDVYRTTDSSVATGAYRFYIVNLEGVDPNIRRIYYDITPSAMFTGSMPHRIEITAPSATGITYQRKNPDGTNDGAALLFSFGTTTVSPGVEFVVAAVTPQHDDARLSRIVYRQQRLNNWYYYHGVPEIYVSDPLEIIASEDASSYNGRDSANFQSPPHVGYASAVVRQHQSADSPWFEELLDRNHVITGQRVHIMLRDKDYNYGKDFSGILQSPPIQHRDNIYDWRLSIHDPTTLMVQSFANSALLVGPQDAVSTRTVGSLIQRVCQAYADRVANLNLDDVLDPTFDPDHFPVPLAWFWTDYESERDILQRLVNTQGPPTGFYVNSLGQLVFTGCEDRGEPIYLGGADGIPITQSTTFSDHVVDVANDARIPVSLHGWVLPDAAATPEEVYQEPDGLPEAVQVQLFETYSDNAIFDLARGGNIVFDANGEYRYRVRTGNPVLPPDVGGVFRVIGSSDVTVTQLAANMLDIVATGTAGESVPSFQVFGAELKHFRTMEHWTSPTVRNENATRFSLYLYHQREFSYAGYNSIAQRDAQILADWAVRYYRRGIKTITLQLFCSNDVQEALRLEPNRTPVRIAHNYGAGAPDQWIVRSRKHTYRDGHFWIEVTLDEDIMYSLGLEHSPLCALYEAPDPNDIPTEAKYTVTNAGALTFTGADGAAIIIPQHGLLSLAPNLAATVLPIAQTSADPQLIARHPASTNALFALEPGKYRSAHFNLARLDALNEGICYQDGIHPVQISLWLVEPAMSGDSYWAVVRFRFNADAYDGLIPSMFHFMRVRYAALGLHQDVVLSFVTPPTTMHMGEAHWITVAQEQPWLDADDAGVALTYNQHVIILDWQAFETDITNSNNGSEDGGVYVNDAVIASDAMPSTNVKNATGVQIARRFGRS